VFDNSGGTQMTFEEYLRNLSQSQTTVPVFIDGSGDMVTLTFETTPPQHFTVVQDSIVEINS
jgi:hypothetical protein